MMEMWFNNNLDLLVNFFSWPAFFRQFGDVGSTLQLKICFHFYRFQVQGEQSVYDKNTEADSLVMKWEENELKTEVMTT